MKTEQQLRDVLTSCRAVADWGMSKGPCPMDTEGERGCCAECSTPAAIAWVLDERQDGAANGQTELINAIMPNAPVRRGTPSPQVAGSRIFEPYDGIPCTCTDKCDDPCKGKCGCKACYTSYQDFLSNE